MARQSRETSIDPTEIQVIHVWNRCVRRAFLCGLDPLTGDDYEHRRLWARQRLEHLASVFAIDCLTFSLMSNHTHQILRSRPDIVETWDDETVARRWLSLTPKRDRVGNPLHKPKRSAIGELMNNPEELATIRLRLSDVSWWMRYFSQHIAWRSNREDEVTGHFWESRFGSEVIESEASILSCMIYVDLNPVRAAMATSPEESDFTGAKDRIDDLRVDLATGDEGQINLTLSSSEHSIHDWERLDHPHSGWLCPIEIDEAVDEIGPDAEPSGRRVSRKGFVSLSLTRYLELLDWVGRQVRSDKRGSIPQSLAPILQRLGWNARSLLESLVGFGAPPGECWNEVACESDLQTAT
jgi:REP element-mobilizing transposase RayT